MTFVPKPETQNWEAPAGVAPWRELTDEEYADLDARFGPLERFFEQTNDATADTKKKAANADKGES